MWREEILKCIRYIAGTYVDTLTKTSTRFFVNDDAISTESRNVLDIFSFRIPRHCKLPEAVIKRKRMKDPRQVVLEIQQIDTKRRPETGVQWRSLAQRTARASWIKITSCWCHKLIFNLMSCTSSSEIHLESNNTWSLLLVYRDRSEAPRRLSNAAPPPHPPHDAPLQSVIQLHVYFFLSFFIYEFLPFLFTASFCSSPLATSYSLFTQCLLISTNV